jgi:hypothetical protein
VLPGSKGNGFSSGLVGQFLPAHEDLECEALGKAVPIQVEGVPTTYVSSSEHLVALALQTGRAKDYARIVQFVEQEVVDPEQLNRILMRHGCFRSGRGSSVDIWRNNMNTDSDRERRKRSASLSFEEKIKILEKLRERLLRQGCARKKGKAQCVRR